MTREDYLKFAREFTDKMLATVEQKSNDYTGGADDVFLNFRTCENMGISSVENGMIVRMLDKFNRIAGFVRGNKLQVANESVIDTLSDLANYSILLAGYLKEKTAETIYKNTPISDVPDDMKGIVNQLRINEL